MASQPIIDFRGKRVHKPSPAKLTADGMVDGSELLSKTEREDRAFARAQEEFDRVKSTPGAWAIQS